MIRDLYAKYCYLLQGNGKIFYFCNKSINTFADAHSFQRENRIIIFVYIFTVPIIMIFEYILEQTGTIVIADFNLKSVFRIYILVFSFGSNVCLQSFSRSFRNILPFINFEQNLGAFAIIKVSNSLTFRHSLILQDLSSEPSTLSLGLTMSLTRTSCCSRPSSPDSFE